MNVRIDLLTLLLGFVLTRNYLNNAILCHPDLCSVNFLLASERSERDTYRGNTIENRGCLFIYLLASERRERDTYRGNIIENRGCL